VSVPNKLETLDDVRMHLAEESGRTEAYWSQQHERNRTFDRWKLDVERRFTALERRVGWICGVTAAVGAVIGSLVAVYAS